MAAGEATRGTAPLLVMVQLVIKVEDFSVMRDINGHP
jgi:hypothetical protein